MKYFFVLFTICAISLQGIADAQIVGAPLKISYQGALTYIGAHGKIMPVKKGMYKLTFDFYDDATEGNLIYSESDSVTADKNGIYVVTIGENGTPSGQIADNFALLNWLKVTIDGGPEKHIAYPLSLTRIQFTSVPYALTSLAAHAARNSDSAHIALRADSARASHTADNLSHYVGESYGGGIVFWVDASGQHGLIAATTDQSTGMRWYAGALLKLMALADGVGAGKANTAIIIAILDEGDDFPYAARVCNEYQGGGYGDWYLPSKYELNLLYLQKAVVGGFASANYWSSTRWVYGGNKVWSQNFSDGLQNYDNTEDLTYYVRAVRAF